MTTLLALPPTLAAAPESGDVTSPGGTCPRDPRVDGNPVESSNPALSNALTTFSRFLLVIQGMVLPEEGEELSVMLIPNVHPRRSCPCGNGGARVALGDKGQRSLRKGMSFQGWMRRSVMLCPNVHPRRSFQCDKGGARVALRDRRQWSRGRG